MASQSNPNVPPLGGEAPADESRPIEERHPTSVTSIESRRSLPPDANISRRSSATHATPLDAIFILLASVTLLVLILSLSPVRQTEPFQNLPDWFRSAVSSFWSRLTVGAGALSTIGLRKWLDRSPAPNYLVWISSLTAGLLAAVLFSAAVIIPPPATVLTGSIEEPKPNQTVSRRTFVCKGRVNGVGPQTHLWLAVEANNHIWPKEREVHVLADGTWENTIYEDGATDKFSISLLSATPAAEKQIDDWIEAGKKSGQYAELNGIPAAERIARVDGIKLRAN